MTVLVDRTSDWGSSQSFKRWESKPGIGHRLVRSTRLTVSSWSGLDERALWY